MRSAKMAKSVKERKDFLQKAEAGFRPRSMETANLTPQQSG
jgi:hypothetical protein